MAAALPVVCFVLLWIAAQQFPKTRRTASCPREAFVLSTVIWGVFLWAVTETLSAFHALAPTPLAITWSLAALVPAAYLFMTRRELPATLRRLTEGTLDAGWPVLAAAAIAAVTGLVALVAPTSNVDSMDYHMARVAHWTAHRSIGFFPTHVARELYMSPWAEFAVLHLQVLSGTDHLANFVQWFAMLGSLVACSLIARELGGSARAQAGAALLCATIPIGILEASTTQTDYAEAYWAAAFVYLAVRAARSPHLTVRQGTEAGCALGLAVLAKATAYAFLAPFVAWMAFAHRRPSLRQAAAPLGACLLAAFLIDAPHYARSARWFGSPIPSRDGIANQIHTPAAIASNVLRDFSMEFSAPKLNRVLENAVRALHRPLGISPDDPRTSLVHNAVAPTTRYRPTPNLLHEDTAPNPLHAIIMLAAALASMAAGARARTTARRQLAVYAAAWGSGFLLFAAGLKWQLWITRLLLQWFVLGAPMAAVAMEQFLRPGARSAVYLAVAAGSLPFLLMAQDRSLLPVHLTRTYSWKSILSVPYEDRYFANYAQMEQPMRQAAQYIRSHGLRSAGLVGANGEYLLRVALHDPCGYRYPLEHYVANSTGSPGSGVQTPPPPYIVAISCPVLPGGYSPVWADGPIVIARRTE